MSGGVDSAVAAALLKRDGFEVTGVTLNLFAPERSGPACCGSADSAARARAVCDAIGIRHYVKNAERVFGDRVIGDFVRAYSAGRTPNPCVECNRYVKFSYLFDLAVAFGAEYLATGHYARIEAAGGEFRLLRGTDPLKDQSYFLYCLKKDQLPRLLFPLGALEKREVRRISAGLGLPMEGVRESSDICFVGGGSYGKYLAGKGLEPRPGRIVDSKGKILGRHDGYFNYTIGQRRGLGVYGGGRMYVSALRPATNEVVLGGLEDASFSSFTASGMNWLSAPPKTGDVVRAQIRYRHVPAACRVASSDGYGFSGTFEKSQFAPASGQSVVFYDGDRVLGGGVIETVG